jgi:hypothetical protein
MVTGGLSKKQALHDLCCAIADGKIAIRLILAADRARGLPRKELSFPQFETPSHLLPKDIDWRRSRPSPNSQISTGPSQRLGQPVSCYIQQNYSLMGRTVDLIEVRVPDVIKVFCNTESQPEAKPPATKPAASPALLAGNAAKFDAAVQAMKALWPNGIPAGLGAKDRNRRISDWQQANGLSKSSVRTMQRAIKAFRP